MGLSLWIKSKAHEVLKRSRIIKSGRKLANRNPDIRRAAALALGEIKDSRVVEPLIAALNDEVLSVKSAAQQALATIGDPSVIPLIFTGISGRNTGRNTGSSCREALDYAPQ